jgi:hypothetical protein
MEQTDDWVRLGLALVIIALISVGMHQFSAHAHTVDATFVTMSAGR